MMIKEGSGLVESRWNPGGNQVETRWKSRWNQVPNQVDHFERSHWSRKFVLVFAHKIYVINTIVPRGIVHSVIVLGHSIGGLV